MARPAHHIAHPVSHPGGAAHGSGPWHRPLNLGERALHALGRATLRVLYRLDLVPRVPDEDEIFVVLLGGRLDDAPGHDDGAIETTLTEAR
ncbi:MAG: hypothetical protein R3C39_12955 [Dehalococcoidia bacterium]